MTSTASPSPDFCLKYLPVHYDDTMVPVETQQAIDGNNAAYECDCLQNCPTP